MRKDPIFTEPNRGALRCPLSRRSALAAGLALTAGARAGSAWASSPLNDRLTAITRLIELVLTEYQNPALANVAAQTLRTNALAGTYSGINEPPELAQRLTRDLVEVTADKHLKVSAEAGPSAPADPAHDAGFLRSVNYGVMGIRQSQAEVAIVTINFFPELRTAPSLYNMYGGLMSLITSSRGLVIDLRGNMGGSPETVAHLMSYFFDVSPRKKIAEVIYRHKAPQTYYTSERLAGPRYGKERPLVIIVSHSTFSAGEAFAYHLRAQRRAVIVGEATGGGANPGDSFRLNDTFSAFIPTGRVVDAVTGANWEGSGIKPDIAATGDHALPSARQEVLKAALPLAKDANERAEIQFGLTHT